MFRSRIALVLSLLFAVTAVAAWMPSSSTNSDQAVRSCSAPYGPKPSGNYYSEGYEDSVLMGLFASMVSAQAAYDACMEWANGV